MSFMVHNNLHNRHSYGANQKPYYIPHPTNHPQNSPTNVTIALPPPKAIPNINYVRPNNISPPRPLQTQHPDQVLERSNESMRLKRQLADITTESDKKHMYEERRNNRSSDNVYAPHQRISNGDRVQGMNVSKGRTNRISQTISLECFPAKLAENPK